MADETKTPEELAVAQAAGEAPAPDTAPPPQQPPRGGNRRGARAEGHAHDEAPAGGRFMVDGRLVNAEGTPIKE